MRLNFEPPWILRNPHIQTLSAKFWQPVTPILNATAEQIRLTVNADGETVKLIGAYAAQPVGKRQGVVLILHGWLGCIDSTYMLGRGEALFRRGYAVFRLNMRDHGGTAALNEGLFHGARLEEVYQAARQVSQLAPDSPLFIIGFSMGGNFALRLAWQHSRRPIPNLKGVIAVSPSIDPGRATDVLDRRPFYRHYFRQRWLQSLREKQAAFPRRYNFDHIIPLKTCAQIAEALIAEYSDFPTLEAYYRTYAFTADKLRPVTVPTTILTAADDPVIPVSSFQDLADVNPLTTLHILPYGGHVGFVDGFPLRSWLDEAVGSILRQGQMVS